MGFFLTTSSTCREFTGIEYRFDTASAMASGNNPSLLSYTISTTLSLISINCFLRSRIFLLILTIVHVSFNVNINVCLRALLLCFFDYCDEQIVQFLPAMTDTVPNLKKAFALYTLVYILALIVAGIIGYAVRNLNPVFIVLVTDIAATLVVFGMGRVFHNASLYDAYWSIAPLAIILFLVLGAFPHSAVILRQLIASVLVFLWGFRLTWNWAHQWHGIKHEDWRYRDLRENNQRWFWLIELVGIDLMPTLIVFLACLPLYPVLVVGKNSINLLDVIACVVTAGAIAIEAVADRQLWQFSRQKSRSGEIMTKGLWAYSRHPNYFGEIMFWWGIFLFGLAAAPDWWWTVIGPVSVTILFTFVSVPLMDKRNLAKRPDYAAIKKKIPALFPWFPKTY